MATNPAGHFEIPPEMRAFAEKSFEQAKQAFEGFINAAQHTVTTFQGQAETARQSAQDVGAKAMSFAQQNITSSFEFAHQLMQAKDLKEMLDVQTAYIQRQMQVLGEQAKELGQATGKVVKDATEPKA
jgi:phasin